MGQVSFFRKPCLPIQPGFFLLTICNSADDPSSLLPSSSPLFGHPLPIPFKVCEILLGLITFFCRIWMLNSFLSQMCIGVVLIPYCLHSYVLHIIQKISVFVNIKRNHRHFQQLQTLIKNYNFIHCKGTATILIFIICEGTLSMYAFISLGPYLSIERRFIFGYTALTMFLCVTIVYGTLSETNQESNTCLQLFKKQRALQQSSWNGINHKLLRSLFPFRIALGSGGAFVDIGTPLQSQQLIIDQTVNLSLLH